MHRINPKDLKVGDIFYESSQYGNVKCEVVEPVYFKSVEFKDKSRIQYIWKAKIISEGRDGGAVVTYKITEGLESYGPKIYTHPAYATQDEFFLKSN